MEITVEHHPHVVLPELVDHLLDVMDGRKGLLDSVFVLSVEVAAGQVAPRVPHYHSVRVEHRNDLKDEEFPQSLGSLRVAGEIVEDAPHDPGGGRLSRVYSSSDDDGCKERTSFDYIYLF